MGSVLGIVVADDVDQRPSDGVARADGVTAGVRRGRVAVEELAAVARARLLRGPLQDRD
jgi:hypothetical protein